MARRGDALGATSPHGAVMQYMGISTVLTTRHACKSGPAGVSPARYAASNESVSDSSWSEVTAPIRAPTSCRLFAEIEARQRSVRQSTAISHVD